ncbi:MAG: hypothetical protein M3Q93_04295 [Gemmatimonadota bacterium]|nr:hypothetical protein [Gemmatimonadota bacterium]
MPTTLCSFLAALALLVACSARPGFPAPERAGETAGVGPDAVAALAAAESSYAVVRDLRDRLDVASSAGERVGTGRATLDIIAKRYDSLRAGLPRLLAAVASGALPKEDARALRLMHRALARDFGPTGVPGAALPGTAVAAMPAVQRPPDCGYDPRSIAAAPNALDSLRARIYACYGWAQSHVAVGADTLDRLSILGAIGRTGDATRRRELFLALAPVWRSINAENTPASPYRRLIALEVRARGGAEPHSTALARAPGVPADSLGRWLLAVLETWRNSNPDTLVEPWDWYYRTGSTSRILGPHIPRERLRALNDSTWGALGADVRALGVHYDLDPREGKDPVAFTTFGGRAPAIEPWVFATYRAGGLDNLNELLHETGHAAHIAAIRTRPAFRDWPDSDPFTEAVADVVALDVYDPAWQLRWLGDSVPLAEGLRSRYGGIVLDVAWALFETRMLRDPEADPNAVWTALTRDYLRIRPHPELSWWAMRGQLVDAPGYMMNYAAGSILIAALRARIRELHGPFTAGDSTWYAWVAPRLYRFGLERPSSEVIEAFLGGPVSADALLTDMRRMGPDTKSAPVPR